MSGKQQQRAQVLNGLLERRISSQTAAHLMGLSARQLRRLRQAYRRDRPRAYGPK